MKKLLYLFLLFPIFLFAQPRYGVEGIPMCWKIGSIDSNITRYVIISSTGSPVQTIAWENAAGQVINVSGGYLRYGYCDCAGSSGSGGNGIYGGSGTLPNALVQVQNTQGIKFVEPGTQNGILIANKANGAAGIALDPVYTDSIRQGLVWKQGADSAAVGIDKDGRLQLLSNNWVAIGNDQAKIIIRKDDAVVLIKTGNNVYALADGVPLSGKNNVMLWPNGSGSGRFANLDSLVDGRAKRDTFITVPPNTNYFQNTIDYPSRFYNNIYLSCKGRTDTSIVAFLAAPVFEEQKGVVYHIKNDSGLVAAFVINYAHLSNNKRFYLLKRGQTAQVRLLPDAANGGNYGWAVNVVWDSIGDGNGLISALPLGNVTIPANGHRLRLDSFPYLTLTSRGDFAPHIGLINKSKANAHLWIEYDFRNIWGNYVNSKGFAVGFGQYGDKISYQWPFMMRYDSIANESWGLTNMYGSPFMGSRHFFYGASGENEFSYFSRSPSGKRSIILRRNGDGDAPHFVVRNNGKITVGQDSSFIHDPTVDITRIKGQTIMDFAMIGDSSLYNIFSIPYRFLRAKAGLQLGNRGDNITGIDFYANKYFTQPSNFTIADFGGSQLQICANGCGSALLRMFPNGDFVFGNLRYQSNTLSLIPVGEINIHNLYNLPKTAPSPTSGAISSPTWTAGIPAFLRSQHKTISGTTDGSGDITITFDAAMPDATYTVIVTGQGATPYVYMTQPATLTTGSVKVRMFNLPGAAATSTAYQISYEVKDTN